jgi:GT2 family glycosyltransferase
MSHEHSLEAAGHPPYAQTANCMVRRAAFEAIGGFVDDVRSGGDADLCFRLLAAGWTLERRPSADVVHRNRRTVASLIGQKARHGSGAAWLDARYAGTFPRRRTSSLVRFTARETKAALTPGGRVGDRAPALLDAVLAWAFELGRLLPNNVRRAR